MIIKKLQKEINLLPIFINISKYGKIRNCEIITKVRIEIKISLKLKIFIIEKGMIINNSKNK